MTERLMTNKQSWAIFKIYGYDVRNTDITLEEASNLISAGKGGNSVDIEENLEWLSEVDGADKKRDIGEVKPKQDWQALYDKAHEAGHNAAVGHEPEPMIVVERANPLDDSSQIIKQYEPVMDGVCGFAWVKLSPATHSFCRWLKKKDLANKGYRGGYEIWISDYNQSMEKKLAYATAFSKIVNDAIPELKVYPQSRMD